MAATTFVLVLTFCTGTASAIKLHPVPPSASFGPDGTSASSFESLKSIVFQQAEKKVFALDETCPICPGGNDLYGFDVSTPGSYLPLAGFDPLPTPELERSSLAVDNSNLSTAGNVFFTVNNPEENMAYGLSPTGATLSGWPVSPPGGAPIVAAAVDPDGHVWLVESALGAPGHIVEYSSAGALLSSIDTPQGVDLERKLAFDSNGDLYTTINNAIWRFAAPSYEDRTEVVAPGRAGGAGIAVDGADHTIYVAGGEGSGGSERGIIWRFAPDGTLLEKFDTAIGTSPFRSVAVDEASGEVYASTVTGKILVFPPLEFPLPITGGVSDSTDSSATLTGTVKPEGLALSDCHFEYVTAAAFAETGFNDLASGGSVPCEPAAGSIPADSASHAVSAPVTGLDPDAPYSFRLVAANVNGSNAGQPVSFTLGQPGVETVGSPLRTATTTRLDSRVNPHGLVTEYHFEYGDQGPCATNPCVATPTEPAGSGDAVELASQNLTGLRPDTTYHYRIVADNGNGEGPSFGEDMTLQTRVTDAPLSHGDFAGPAGSDRAWEQVNTPDTGGNPVRGATAISDDGTRALYQIAGGNPLSEAGSLFNQLFAERGPLGWRTEKVYPTREQANGNIWLYPSGRRDLSELTVTNFSNGAGSEESEVGIWQLRPGSPASRVLGVEQAKWGQFAFAAEDGSTMVTTLRGTQDPSHPVSEGNTQHLYDITSGTPKLIDLLPDGSLSCLNQAGTSAQQLPGVFDVARAAHWVSSDGTRVFFPSEPNASNCSGPTQLYMRDIEAEATTLVSSPPVSGPSCPAQFIKDTPDAAFFWSPARLTAEDAAPSSCPEIPESKGGDVYRYDTGDGALDCVTCAGGAPADVVTEGNSRRRIAVSEDGSHVYFESPNRLVAGAATPGIYGVDLDDGRLSYVAPGGTAVGDVGVANEAISWDGSVLVFASSSPQLNSLNGPQNGGMRQYYRYDDDDRSLVCVSCPSNGGRPTGPVPNMLINLQELGPNLSPLDDAGDLVFTAPSPLVSADQNTARPGQDPVLGMDLYEWRGGRTLLVSDGLTRTPPGVSATLFPQASGITPDGRDVFFIEAAALTPDALDGYPRLYDARIGGGFSFPPPPRPCSLEVCQGTPKGAPEEAPPGSGSFSGPGNARRGLGRKPRCRKGSVRRHGRCAKVRSSKRGHRRARHDRRAGR